LLADQFNQPFCSLPDSDETANTLNRTGTHNTTTQPSDTPKLRRPQWPLEPLPDQGPAASCDDSGKVRVALLRAKASDFQEQFSAPDEGFHLDPFT